VTRTTPTPHDDNGATARAPPLPGSGDPQRRPAPRSARRR
jgi:hypothetical protein